MKIPKGARIIGLAAALAVAVPASGQVLSELDGLVAREVVSDQELDGIRGGIDIGGVFSLVGIERVIQVGDEITYRTTIPASSVTGQPIPPAVLQKFQDIYGSGAVTVQPDLTSSPAIQNSIDSEKLRVTTTVNLAAFGLSRINRSLSMSSMIAWQIRQSLR